MGYDQHKRRIKMTNLINKEITKENLNKEIDNSNIIFIEEIDPNEIKRLFNELQENLSSLYKIFLKGNLI